MIYTKTCPVCGKEFSFYKASLIAVRKYCSAGCRNVGRTLDKRIHKTCEVCGKALEVSPALKNRRFCSQVCMGKSMERPLAERLWEKIDKSGGPDACWPWTGGSHGRRKCKYGSIDGQQAHRVVWELTNGPIPDKLGCLHSCDFGLCCNPKHLFLGTQVDNIHDMIAKGRYVKPPQLTTEQHARGSRSGQSKLIESDVIEIRKLATQGFSGAEIARKYGVIKENIYHIIHRRSWKHI